MDGARILVVDDSAAVLKLVRSIFESEGFEVLTASSPEKALRLVVTEGSRPDLVVSDVQMPHMDGWTLCDAVRGTPPGRNVPFLFLSEHARPADRGRASDPRLDDFLAKPFPRLELLARARALLARMPPSSGSASDARAGTAGPVRSAPAAHGPASRQVTPLPRTPAPAAPREILAGRLDSFPVSELLQMAKSASEPCRIEIRDVDAFLDVRNGRLVAAGFGPHRGMKAVHRILALSAGEFRIVPVVAGPLRPEAETLAEEIDSFTMSAWVVLDHQRELLARLGGHDGALRAAPGTGLEGLDPEAAAMVLHVERTGRVSGCLDASPRPDADVLEVLSRLVREGRVVVG